MLTTISQEIKRHLQSFSRNDVLLFNNEQLAIEKGNFHSLHARTESPRIAFVDGGQAEIISIGNFCLSFIRVFGQVFQGKTKIQPYKKEMYLFSKAVWNEGDIFYKSTIFSAGEPLLTEGDLFLSSQDTSLKIGKERAPITRITAMARRLAELRLASMIDADFVVLDGTLEPAFTNEEKYLSALPDTVSALAKTSTLLTLSGNSPVILLQALGPAGCWSYFVNNKTYFTKLQERAKHVFRFEGNKEVLPYLLEQSQDALFLGYPYGLILADQMARVSNMEKKSLRMSFLLKAENKEIVEYLNAGNAHEILDSLG